MKTLKGISAAPGMAKGIVCVYSTENESRVAHYSISKNQVDNETHRLHEAFEKARIEMRKMIEKAKALYDAEAAGIFNAHLAFLNDEAIIKRSSEFIKERRINAEHAVSHAFDEYIRKYSAKKGHFKELTHDFADTRNHVLDALGVGKGKFKCPIGERQPVIVVAKRLTPSMVLNIPRKNALAFVAKEGGLTSHATILARSYGVPIIFGIEVEKEFDCGMKTIIDGSLGKVIINPDKRAEKYYELKIENFRKKQYVCEIKKGLSARTKRGIKIKLKLNISTPEEIDIIKGLPHGGIGLLRTEFLFMHRQDSPTEDEQYRMYKRFLEYEKDKPVTIRVLDIGADKQPTYLNIPEQANPDMGLRGAIAVETFPDIYLTQMKALLRANTGSNLWLLYPMVSDLDDFRTFRALLSKAKGMLRKEKVKFNARGIKEGVMIETPGAVMMVGELLKAVDFINIGSNDLLQYTLAASRGNMLVERRYHVLHPALVKFMELIVKEAKKAKKEVCLCGEIASFEEYYPLFLKLGLKSFSVAVSKFDDIKCELLHLQKARSKEMLRKYYQLKSREEADKYFERFV